jgi:2-polyprenyl-3-methyl-5-hydroxy-6-metoxy-1,4-benzoquinol methylase
MVPPDAPTATCRLCGSSRVVFWGSRRGSRFTNRVFRFQRCCECDFRFVDPVTGAEIYDEAYYAGRGIDPLVQYEAEYADYRSTARMEEFEGLSKVVSAHFRATGNRDVRQPLTWLDYGCGAGGLLKYLRDRRSLPIAGVDVPVEPSGFDVGVYAERLREVDRLRIYSEDELERLPSESFDVISLIEVIEHVERPLEVLSLASRLLKPGGLLLLTTGNLACPLARWQGVRFAYCLPEIHISLWTPRSLRSAYERVGLVARQFQCEGSIRFKIAKNLTRFESLKAAGSLWYSKPVVLALDWLFGVSAMPMAIKPAVGGHMTADGPR